MINSNKPKVLKRIRRKYICDQCSLKFPSQKKLKLHMLSHLDNSEKKSVTEEISTETSLSSSGKVKKEFTSNDDVTITRTAFVMKCSTCYRMI